MEKLFIIDAFNYLFRSYYAIGPMTNEKGESTSALFGFIRSIKKLIADFSCKYMVCVFDGPSSKKERKKVYSAYKLNRKKAPGDLCPQFDLAYKFCELSNIPVFCAFNFEADDSMASIANWAKKNNFEVFLCTSDKDLFQMVEKNVHIVLANKNNMIVNEKKVKEIFGVLPSQIQDFLAITGDVSDNIPGIAGFGPKTAAELLSKFSNLEEILKNIDKISSKRWQEILKKEKEKAILSKKLTKLNINVKFPQKKDFFAIKSPDVEKLSLFYQEMKFNTLLKELNVSFKTKSTETKIKKRKTSHILINSEKELKKLTETLLKEKEICIDTETTSIHPMQAKLAGIGFASNLKESYFVPLYGNIDQKIIFAHLKKILENPKTSFFGHNIKYDLHVLLNHNIKVKNISFDTIIASYLINPQKRRHNLDILSLEYFNFVKTSYKDLIGKKKSIKDVELEKLKNYCLEDIDCTVQLKEIFIKLLKEKEMEKIFYDIELKLLFILLKMEREGIYVDKKKLEELKKFFLIKIKDLESKIFEKTKIKFNLNSPKQLSDILFHKLKLPFPKRKKTKYSTSADVLQKLSQKFLVVKEILNYRTMQKFLTTYIEALPKQINKETEKIHPTFSQSTTATGRLSCQDPNLQNIPVKTVEGMKIRQAFLPKDKNFSFISADYSQIELRILAHFSKDENLIKAFQKKEDIHASTASLIFKVPIKKVSSNQRKIAKAVNFGILYGQGAFALSEQLAIDYKDAKKIIDTYFEKYPKVKNFINQCIQKVEKTKIAITLLGRKRPIFEIDSKNPIIKKQAQRLAINTTFQGTTADIIKIAMINIDKEIKNLQGSLILQIHDELIFEVPDNEISTFKKIIKEEMEKAVKLIVPIVVDIKVGKNWAEC